ncbi:MAG: Ig-like domain-containing protein [Eubacterium sp.]|nr:Ig-like domain-containing protein [Eubacterium sp.]
MKKSLSLLLAFIILFTSALTLPCFANAEEMPHHIVTFDANGGKKGSMWHDTIDIEEYESFLPNKPIRFMINVEENTSVVEAPAGKVFDGMEVNGVRYPKGKVVDVTATYDIRVKFLWKGKNDPPKPQTEEKADKVITSTNTDKKDVSGSRFKRFKLKASAKSKSVVLTWKAVSGADKYIIYGSKCGKKMKKVATIKNPKTTKKTIKKLKKATYYKYMIVACKNTSAGSRVFEKSKTVHCTTDGGKNGNPNGISLKKAKVSVKKNKTYKITPSLTGKKKIPTHIAKFRYESASPDIATVTSKGTVKGVKKGKTKIYVYTQNGIYKTVTVTVK